MLKSRGLTNISVPNDGANTWTLPTQRQPFKLHLAMIPGFTNGAMVDATAFLQIIFGGLPTVAIIPSDPIAANDTHYLCWAQVGTHYISREALSTVPYQLMPMPENLLMDSQFTVVLAVQNSQLHAIAAAFIVELFDEIRD